MYMCPIMWPRNWCSRKTAYKKLCCSSGICQMYTTLFCQQWLMYARNISYLILDIPMISQRYPKDIPKISHRYPKDIPKISQIYLKDISKICQRYPKDIPGISQRYPKDIPNISPRYLVTSIALILFKRLGVTLVTV